MQKYMHILLLFKILDCPDHEISVIGANYSAKEITFDRTELTFSNDKITCAYAMSIQMMLEKI